MQIKNLAKNGAESLKSDVLHRFLPDFILFSLWMKLLFDFRLFNYGHN